LGPEDPHAQPHRSGDKGRGQHHPPNPWHDVSAPAVRRCIVSACRACSYLLCILRSVPSCPRASASSSYYIIAPTRGTPGLLAVFLYTTGYDHPGSAMVLPYTLRYAVARHAVYISDVASFPSSPCHITPAHSTLLPSGCGRDGGQVGSFLAHPRCCCTLHSTRLPLGILMACMRAPHVPMEGGWLLPCFPYAIHKAVC
jgi:hypothetical protein